MEESAGWSSFLAPELLPMGFWFKLQEPGITVVWFQVALQNKELDAESN